MTLVERLREKITAAGFSVSPRDDVGVPAACWYFDKKPKTLANWRCAGIGPRSLKVGGSVRYPLEGFLAYELALLEKAANSQ